MVMKKWLKCYSNGGLRLRHIPQTAMRHCTKQPRVVIPVPFAIYSIMVQRLMQATIGLTRLHLPKLAGMAT